jgi:hypothetical protein
VAISPLAIADFSVSVLLEQYGNRPDTDLGDGKWLTSMGKYPPGTSGNPKGRPKGLRGMDSRTLVLLKAESLGRGAATFLRGVYNCPQAPDQLRATAAIDRRQDFKREHDIPMGTMKGRDRALHGLSPKRDSYPGAPRSLTPCRSCHDALLMGVALTQAQSWLTKRTEDLPAVDRGFIQQSAKRETQMRARARRAQALIYMLLVGIIAALVGWINQSYVKEQWNWYAKMRPYRAANCASIAAPVRLELSGMPCDCRAPGCIRFHYRRLLLRRRHLELGHFYLQHRQPADEPALARLLCQHGADRHFVWVDRPELNFVPQPRELPHDVLRYESGLDDPP